MCNVCWITKKAQTVNMLYTVFHKICTVSHNAVILRIKCFFLRESGTFSTGDVKVHFISYCLLYLYKFDMFTANVALNTFSVNDEISWNSS